MSAHKLITDHLDLWTGAVTHKSGTGRGASGKNGKIELTGIKKLRELILELAVRGKLVEQDPNDEPASVLLERIAEEKARLVKEGKIKKPKELPEIAEDEKPFGLPYGWQWTCLGNISQINPRNDAEDNLQATFVPMPLISTSYYGEHGQEPRPWSEIKKGYTHFADGDIAIAKITPCFENSKAAVFRNLENGIGAGTTELHIARPYGATLNPLYVLLCLKSPRFLSNGEKKMTGSAGQKRVPKDYFAGEPLPFPPLAEQHRIVAKVDELMALCDRLEQQVGDQLEAHEVLVDTLLNALTRSTDAPELGENWARVAEHFDALFTTEASIDKLKQTVLQLAVMGRLVPQNPNDEPASVLLERIVEERERLVKQGEIKKPKKLPPIYESEKPHELPNSWQWTYFQSTGYTRLGKMLDKAKNQGEHKKYLRNTNVKWWKFDLSDIKTLLLEEHELSEYSVKNGDLLICEGGEPGRCAVWENAEQEIYIQKAIHRHRTFGGVSPHFLKICLTVSATNGQLSKLFTGATIKHLPGDKLARYICPFPPPYEQHRIVEKVDKLMTLCDQLKSRLSESGKTRSQLAETIMEQAVS
ncbi:restriction endonuclease subunit S [Chromohalobacter nigrandesensis]|uniref:restriction endonuclease subunit S n=1 Tax=Chromohalobacter nigrandesensis TaxID=119863 RepID=UPI001FF5F2D6|nr:restriction endonuclease subunit S [Chromohalobacter nigrandesensis]MCK0744271.1 restriction endonuclease subunit S [Chromohalobacter nigrandesensis]